MSRAGVGMEALAMDLPDLPDWYLPPAMGEVGDRPTHTGTRGGKGWLILLVGACAVFVAVMLSPFLH